MQLGAVQSAGYEDDVAELMGDIHFHQGELGSAREAYRVAFEAAEAGPRREVLELKLRSVPAVAEVPAEDVPATPPPGEPAPPTAAPPTAEDAPAPDAAAAPPPEEGA